MGLGVLGACVWRKGGGECVRWVGGWVGGGGEMSMRGKDAELGVGFYCCRAPLPVPSS